MLLLNKRFLITTGCLVSSLSHASMFFKEQSITYLGNANAGTAAYAKDASIGYYNPAGLTDLGDGDLVLSVAAYDYQTEISPSSASNDAGTALSTAKIKDSLTKAVPAGHLSWRINDNWMLGMSIASPFSINTSFDRNSSIAPFGYKTKIDTVDISPSIAYKINDHWSLGIGADFVQFKTQFATSFSDSYIYHQGKNWAYGWHAGAILHLSEKITMGLSYHYRLKVTSQQRVNTDGGVVTPVPQSFTAKIRLPHRITYSIVQHHSNKWKMMADFEYLTWGNLKNISFNYNNGSVTENYNLKDSFRLALGVDYLWSNKLTLKGGIGYDRSPVPENNRGARFIDHNAYRLAMGASYAARRNMVLDIAYNFLMYDNGNVNPLKATNNFGTGNESFTGSIKRYGHIIGLQAKINII